VRRTWATAAAEFVPGTLFPLELLRPAAVELVILGAAIISETPQRRFDQPRRSRRCRRGIERALLDLQNVFGDLLNAFGNAQPCCGSRATVSEDELDRECLAADRVLRETLREP